MMKKVVSDNAVRDLQEPEQRIGMMQKLSLLLRVCSTVQHMIQGTGSDSGKMEEMIGRLNQIHEHQKQHNNRHTRGMSDKGKGTPQ